MSPSQSSYLNVLRFVAALLVYLSHASFFAGVQFPVIGNLGSEAVILFFVLSGLVITYSVRLKSPSASRFVVDRLARLWSVVMPALVLTFVLDVIGFALSESSYAPLQRYSPFKWVLTTGVNATFLNQIWHLNVWPGSNGPFWSIGYEFWFYVIFGIALFCRGWHRIVLLMAAVAVAGPSIIGTFPIWCLGVLLCFNLGRSAAQAHAVAWGVWTATWVIAIAALYFQVDAQLRVLFPSAAEHAKWDVNFWPTSYTLGILVALNIYAFGGIRTFDRLLTRHQHAIRVVADTSFGLYLFHYPMLYVAKAAQNHWGVTGSAYVAITLTLPLLASLWLAHRCESLRPMLARVLTAGRDRIVGVVRTPAHASERNA